MQSIMNLKIKYRESFRPFAPSVLSETADRYFELKNGDKSPYMLLVAPLKKERCLQPQGQRDDEDLISWVNQARSDLPSVTHVDFSARIQTVDAKTNPSFHRLIKAFGEKTGVDVLINTSFNVRGEPIVCTPEDAYRCFMRTEMDLLVLGSWLLRKEEQPKWSESSDWRQEFALD
jgi:carbamoyltransferase